MAVTIDQLIEVLTEARATDSRVGKMKLALGIPCLFVDEDNDISVNEYRHHYKGIDLTVKNVLFHAANGNTVLPIESEYITCSKNQAIEDEDGYEEGNVYVKNKNL